MNKYKLYISSQYIGEYASVAGVWARLGCRSFGAPYMVIGINGADCSEFVPY